MSRFWPILPMALASIAVAATAHASPLIETMGPVGGNGGAQGVVTGPGAASTYFNPALLMDADDELMLGFALISEQMGVTLQGRPQSGDVPLAVAGGGVVTPGRSTPATGRRAHAVAPERMPGGERGGPVPRVRVRRAAAPVAGHQRQNAHVPDARHRQEPGQGPLHAGHLRDAPDLGTSPRRRPSTPTSARRSSATACTRSSTATG